MQCKNYCHIASENTNYKIDLKKEKNYGKMIYFYLLNVGNLVIPILIEYDKTEIIKLDYFFKSHIYLYFYKKNIFGTFYNIED